MCDMYYLRLRKLSTINENTDSYEVFVPVSSLSPPCDTGNTFLY